jgi:hypothetical protein
VGGRKASAVSWVPRGGGMAERCVLCSALCAADPTWLDVSLCVPVCLTFALSASFPFRASFSSWFTVRSALAIRAKGGEGDVLARHKDIYHSRRVPGAPERFRARGAQLNDRFCFPISSL